MKKCPKCDREYADHIKFCPRDGTGLVAEDAQTDPLIGRILAGTYEVEKFLGGGGFGNVYKVKNLGLDDPEALKIIHSHHLKDAEVLGRFRREAKLLRKLGSKSIHIVDLYSFREDRQERIFFFTMEYVEGETLTQIIMRDGAMPLDRALVLMRQICSAMRVAHQDHIVHRDLKLDNVLLTRDDEKDRVKILDFGIAKVTAEDTFQAASGGMAGTPGYAAPEQVKNQSSRIGPATDLFATGVIFFNLVTGHDPWVGEKIGAPRSDPSGMEIILRSLENKPLPCRDFAPTLPKSVHSVICKLLEKDPDRRFKSAMELDQALEEIQAQISSETVTEKGRQQRTARFIPGILSAARKTVAVPRALGRGALDLATRTVRSFGQSATAVGESVGGTVSSVGKAAGGSFVGLFRWLGTSLAQIYGLLRKLALPAAVGAAALLGGWFLWGILKPSIPFSLAVAGLEEPMRVGDSGLLSAEVRDSLGNLLQGRDVEWFTRDLAVARIDPQTGVLEATGSGSAVVGARLGDLSDSVRITVAERVVSRIQIDPPELELSVDDGSQFVASGFDEDGVEVDELVRWVSNRPSVADIDAASGYVRGVDSGEAQISAVAETDSLIVGTAVVRVLPSPGPTATTIAEVRVQPPQINLVEGESREVQAQAIGTDGRALQRPVNWQSSAPQIAQVRNGRVVEGLAPGVAEIWASSGNVRGSAQVTVSRNPERDIVADLRLDRSEITLDSAESVQLAAQLLNARQEPVSGQVEWEASPNAGVRLNPLAGSTTTVTAILPGASGTITARAGGEVQREVPVTVNARRPPPVSLEIGDGTSGFEDGLIHLAARLSQTGLTGSTSCARILVKQQDGSPWLHREGHEVVFRRPHTWPASGGSDVPFEITVDPQELGFERQADIGRHFLVAQLEIWNQTCAQTAFSGTPVGQTNIPFCVFKLASGYRACGG